MIYGCYLVTRYHITICKFVIVIVNVIVTKLPVTSPTISHTPARYLNVHILPKKTPVRKRTKAFREVSRGNFVSGTGQNRYTIVVNH